MKQLWRFFSERLWQLEPGRMPRPQAVGVYLAQILGTAARGFVRDRCILQASALTYSTLLAIVPLLALMFSVLKGLGVQKTLEPLIIKNLAVGSEEAVQAIITYIDNTQVSQLGTVGLLALLLTVLMLLSNIEKAFNSIWGVAETRTFSRRFADYFSVVTLGPIIMLAAISMTSSLQSHTLVTTLKEISYLGPMIVALFKMVPFIGMWVVFVALYLFMPNTSVRLFPAIMGGVFGGTLWQLAQFFYVNSQVGVSRYNAIYGTMAALPIFMIWIYVSWIIVLLGVELTYAVQHRVGAVADLSSSSQEAPAYEVWERLAITLMLLLTEAFRRGESWRLEDLRNELRLPVRLLRDLVQHLQGLGLVHMVTHSQEQCYQPAIDPAMVTMESLFQRLRQAGQWPATLAQTPEIEAVTQLQQQLHQLQQQQLQQQTLASFSYRCIQEAAAVPEAEAPPPGNDRATADPV